MSALFDLVKHYPVEGEEDAVMQASAEAELKQLYVKLETTKKDLEDSTAQLELDNDECIHYRAENAEMREALEWYADADNYCTDISQSQIGTAYQLGRVQNKAAAILAKHPEVTE